ncbi:hypothetical protein [Micromonospora avicenniae]|uniref:hypothetical protein n=1 Tax=Micromonospora avicenniae TaxID=1198245 RepID=UPI003440AB68
MSYPPADSHPPSPGRGPYPPPQGGYPGPQRSDDHPPRQQGGHAGRYGGGYPGGRPPQPPQGGGHPGGQARQPPHAGYPGGGQPGSHPGWQAGSHSGAHPGGYPAREPGGYPEAQPGGYPPLQQSAHPGGHPGHPGQHGAPPVGPPGGYLPHPQHGGYSGQQYDAHPGGRPAQQTDGYPGGYPQARAGGCPPHQQGGSIPPQNGQPQEGTAPGPSVPKRSNTGRTVLIVVAVVLVLCLGGGIATWFVIKDDVSDGIEAASTRVVAPETLAGRPRITNAELQSVADQMVTEVKKGTQGRFTSTVGAFYGDPAKRELAMIVSASGLISDPEKELDGAVAEISPELTIAETTPVDPGPLGGEARCGDGKVDATPLGVCLWADRGSVGAIVVYFKSAEEIKAEFVTMRGEIEQRS